MIHQTTAFLQNQNFCDEIRKIYGKNENEIVGKLYLKSTCTGENKLNNRKRQANNSEFYQYEIRTSELTVKPLI